MKNFRKTILFISMLIGGVGVLMAQDYYDDDIYYDASKEKKVEKKQQDKKTPQQNNNISYHYDYPAADTYTVTGTSTRDVDEYNRRGVENYTGTALIDSIATEDFTYTRRIERFYNPSVVSGSSDEELKEYYYSSQEEPAEVNIYYINNPAYWSYPYSSWYWSWYSPWVL